MLLNDPTPMFIELEFLLTIYDPDQVATFLEGHSLKPDEVEGWRQRFCNAYLMIMRNWLMASKYFLQQTGKVHNYMMNDNNTTHIQTHIIHKHTCKLKCIHINSKVRTITQKCAH